MCIESLGCSHGLHGVADVANAFVGEMLEGNLATVAVEVNTVVSHCISVGGQGVVGAAGIVAGTLAGILSKEYTSRIDDPLGESLVIVGLDYEMLGSVGVGEVDGLVIIGYNH